MKISRRVIGFILFVFDHPSFGDALLAIYSEQNH